eukprot:1568809-Lingulodinium_polyedra.AAC.1
MTCAALRHSPRNCRSLRRHIWVSKARMRVGRSNAAPLRAAAGAPAHLRRQPCTAPRPSAAMFDE